MVKIKVTHSGLYFRTNEGEKELEVGKVYEMPEEPTYAVNKYELLSATEDKALEVGKEDRINELREEYKLHTGEEPNKQWGLPRLTQEVEKLRQEKGA